MQGEWDRFVLASKNGTFLLTRAYVDYHRDRFADCSLVIRADDEIVAVLPANRVEETVHSHQGLTYGGFITSDRMSVRLMLDIFAATMTYLREQSVGTLYYKTIPAIYHLLPAEEDRYALFRFGAELYRVDVLSALRPAHRPAFQERRRRGAAKAARANVNVRETADFAPYWALLTAHLRARFNVDPVHSLAEITLLKTKFPDNIRLHVAEHEGELLGGVVIYESASVAHAQYIASSDQGRSMGALDRLFVELIENVYAEKACFDLGASNENNGRVLNEGLMDQKEGFGGRAVAHEFYRLSVGGP